MMLDWNKYQQEIQQRLAKLAGWPRSGKRLTRTDRCGEFY